MSKKQKEKKKKARELVAKKRVLARRVKLRKQVSEDRKLAKLDKKFREKIEPIIKDPEKRKAMQEMKKSDLLKKLEKNAEILKALEDQYNQEINYKNEINDKLESEGHHTIKEKLDALDKKNQENMTQEEKESGKIDLS